MRFSRCRRKIRGAAYFEGVMLGGQQFGCTRRAGDAALTHVLDELEGA
jgi:hypothetical protein